MHYLQAECRMVQMRSGGEQQPGNRQEHVPFTCEFENCDDVLCLVPLIDGRE